MRLDQPGRQHDHDRAPLELGSRLTTPGRLAGLLLILTASAVCNGSPDHSPSFSASPGTVTIRPGDDIQAAVDAHPAGTTFVLATGEHLGQSVEPTDNTTFLGEPGAIMDGDGRSRFAFGDYGPGASNVTIRGLEIRNYAFPPGEGAIQGDNTTGWTVAENHIHGNTGFGIRAGTGMRIVGNHVHDNGVTGIGGYRSNAVLVRGNDVHDNGARGVAQGARATAAGIKFFEVADLRVIDNHVHDNRGRGIWTDTGCIDVVIEQNRVIDNDRFGIWHEIGYGALIRANYVARNGHRGRNPDGWLAGSGIAVTNSTGVRVVDNQLVDNANGIAAFAATGYPESGPNGPYRLADLDVLGNSITQSEGRTGVAANVDSDDPRLDASTLRFSGNRYTLGVGAGFLWLDRELDPAGWRAVGHDANGTFDRRVD